MWRRVAQKGAEALSRSCNVASNSSSSSIAGDGSLAAAAAAALRRHTAAAAAAASQAHNASSRCFSSPTMTTLAARQLHAQQQLMQPRLRSILACGGGSSGSGSSGSSSAAAAAAYGFRGMTTVTDRKSAANPALKFWKPTSPGQRGRVTVRRTGIWRGRPKRALAAGAAKSGGRNRSGRITVWHRGGGARKVLRDVDLLRPPTAPDAVVERLEYDPGRSGYIALLKHTAPVLPGSALKRLEARAVELRQARSNAAAAPSAGGPKPSSSSSISSSPSNSSTTSSSSGPRGPNSPADAAYLAAVSDLLKALKGQRAAATAARRGKQQRGAVAAAAAPRQVRPYSYMLAPQGLSPGDAVSAADGAPVKPGNTMELRAIPVGMPLSNLELRPGQGGALCRSAGCIATIVNKQETHAIVRLPSGEQRLFSMRCRATIGAVSNPQHQNAVIGKAGYARHMGRRPVVRGVAMNPVDHPHGGGTAGGRPSVTPWGVPCKGHRTRPNRRMAKWILVPRRSRQKQKRRGA